MAAILGHQAAARPHAAAVALLVALLAAAATDPSSLVAAVLAPGDAAPAFTVSTLGGGTYSYAPPSTPGGVAPPLLAIRRVAAAGLPAHPRSGGCPTPYRSHWPLAAVLHPGDLVVFLDCVPPCCCRYNPTQPITVNMLSANGFKVGSWHQGRHAGSA